MIKNIYNDIPVNFDKEIFEDILKNDNIRIERIISNGPESNDGNWYNQKENEFVILLKGKAKIIFENFDVELNEGSYINISANTKHKVEITDENEKCIWLAVFY